MGRFTIRFALFGLLVALCILYGIEMATSGIERIQGPLSGQQQEQSEPLEQAQNDVKKPEKETPEKEDRQEPAATQPQPQPLKRSGKEPSVDVLADHTADVLQAVSSGGIRFIVSIFDAITQ